MMDAITRLYYRLRNMVHRGRVLLVSDGGAVQTVQARLGSDDIRDGLKRLAEYGYHSNPPAGTDALVLFAAGDRSGGVIVATNNQTYRLTGLATGEVAIADDLGQVVHLRRDGIYISTSGLLRIDAENIQMHASKSWSWDVAGFGERYTWESGTTWTHKTWQTGATVNTDPQAINPPDGS